MRGRTRIDMDSVEGECESMAATDYDPSVCGEKFSVTASRG